MGLRALGRGPVIEWTWVYGHPVHADAVHDFSGRLAQGLLGRLVQRSSLPGGRHRWVAHRVAAPVTVAAEAIGVEQLPQWRSSLVDLAVDPEHGPGWRLAVQPLEGGGTALSLLVSHTIADGLGVARALCDAALCDAAAGVQPAHAYPARSPQTSWRGVWWRNMMRDAGVSARSLPDAWNAVALLARRARALAPGVSSSVARSAPSPSPSPSRATSGAADVSRRSRSSSTNGSAPRRASALGVSVNTLLAAFSARLGFRLGRVDGDGRVKLVMPVSDRTPGDLRANALQSVTVMVDPCGVLRKSSRPATRHSIGARLLAQAWRRLADPRADSLRAAFPGPAPGRHGTGSGLSGGAFQPRRARPGGQSAVWDGRGPDACVPARAAHVVHPGSARRQALSGVLPALRTAFVSTSHAGRRASSHREVTSLRWSNRPSATSL